MTRIILEVAGDVELSELNLMINDIIEKYEPLLKKGILEV